MNIPKKPDFSPKESSIQSSIKRALEKQYPEALVWKYHSGGRFTGAGMPDLFCLLRGHLYCLEVKRPGKKATDRQEEKMEKLAAAGATVAVVHSVEEALRVIESKEVRT